MTTIVKVSPHPAEGLRVRVTLYDKDGPEEGRDQYLRNGDPEQSYTISPGGFQEAIEIAEVSEQEAIQAEAPEQADDPRD